jgi:hypothetical protein
MTTIKRVRRILSLLLRRYKEYRLEHMVTIYILFCGGPADHDEARRQARELILAGPYSPYKS